MRTPESACYRSTVWRCCLGLLTAVALAGCNQQSDTSDPGTAAIVALEVQLDPGNPLIAHTALQLSAPARAYLEYRAGGVAPLRTSTTATAQETHRIPIVRLRAATSYQVWRPCSTTTAPPLRRQPGR